MIIVKIVKAGNSSFSMQKKQNSATAPSRNQKAKLPITKNSNNIQIFLMEWGCLILIKAAKQ
jgi:hypothetical protein